MSAAQQAETIAHMAMQLDELQACFVPRGIDPKTAIFVKNVRSRISALVNDLYDHAETIYPTTDEQKP